MSWPFKQPMLSGLTVALSLVAQPASAQLFGGRSVGATGCASVAVGGDARDTTITTVCGMPHEKVVELVRLAASPQVGDRTELFARLSGLIPASSQLRIEAIVKFFQLLGEAQVDDSQLPDRFAQIAEQHRRLLEDVKSLRVNDPEVQGLRQQAAAALEIADHITASAKLKEARIIVGGKRETLARVLNDQKREEAALVFEQARIEAARFHSQQAAQLFAEAAHLLPTEDTETRWRYLRNAGEEAMMGSGNPALGEAIYGEALSLVRRTERPLDWAATQNNLGIALLRLGRRESGTARLEKSLVAFRAALEEYTRERVPLDWADSYGTQGFVLMRLAERTKDAVMAQKAFLQIEAALETLRAGGDTGRVNYFEALISDAQRIRDALKVP